MEPVLMETVWMTYLCDPKQLCQQSVPTAIVKGFFQNSELAGNLYDVSNSVSENGLSPDDKRSRRETLILLSQVSPPPPFPFFLYLGLLAAEFSLPAPLLLIISQQ